MIEIKTIEPINFDIGNIYSAALLADVSYVDFISTDELAIGNGKITWGFNKNESNIYLSNKDVLENRMTTPVANIFSYNYELISQYKDDNGFFNGTVARDKDGKLVIAMKGTSELGDFISDGALTAGATTTQAYDMINWWLTLVTPVGETFTEVRRSIEEPFAQQRSGLGLITQDDLSKGITITGHSLGGYLAAIFSEVFSSKYHNVETYTFNAPGITNFFHNLLHIDKETSLKFIDDQIDHMLPDVGVKSVQNNMYAENGVSVTTNGWFFNQDGIRTGIFNEKSPEPSIDNHYMYKITDTMSLARLFKSFDVSFDMRQVNNILRGSMSPFVSTLEDTLDAFRRIIKGKGTPGTLIGDSGNDPKSRENFHNNIDGISSDLGSFVGGKILSPLSITSDIRVSFPSMVSIIEGYPLIITTEDPLLAQEIASNHSELYAQWEHDQEIIAAGSNEPLNFTDMYIESRIEFLKTRHQLGLLNEVDGAYLGTDHGTKSFSFIDYTSGNEPSKYLYGQAGVTPRKVIFGDDSGQTFTDSSLTSGDFIFGGKGNDTIFSYGGNDYIEGGKGNDNIYGGSGSDIINGGSGNNILNGGKGRNIFVVSGNDRITHDLADYVDKPYENSTTVVLMGLVQSKDLKITKIYNLDGSYGLNIEYGSGRNVLVENYSAISSDFVIEMNGHRIKGESLIDLLAKGDNHYEKPAFEIESPEDKSGYISSDKLHEALMYIDNEHISASFIVPDEVLVYDEKTGTEVYETVYKNINNYVVDHGITIKEYLMANPQYIDEENVKVTYDALELYYWNMDDRGNNNSVYQHTISNDFFDNSGSDLFVLGDYNYEINKSGESSEIILGDGNNRLRIGMDELESFSKAASYSGKSISPAIVDGQYLENSPKLKISKIKVGNGDNNIHSKSMISEIETGNGRNDINLYSSQNVNAKLGNGTNFISSDRSNELYIEAGVGYNWINIAESSKAHVILNSQYASVDAKNVYDLKVNSMGQQAGINFSANTAAIDLGQGSHTVQGDAVSLTINSGNGSNNFTLRGNLVASLGSGSNQINIDGTYNITIDGGHSYLNGQSGAYAKNRINKSLGNSDVYLNGGYNVINLGTGIDNIKASSGYFEIHSGGGGDNITLQDISGFIDAGAGDDTITFLYDAGLINPYESKGVTISGGTGDDTIIGSSGSDAFVYDLGDGNDTIYSVPNTGIVGYNAYPGADKIVFGVGIFASDIEVRRENFDLIISMRSGSGSINIKDQFHVILPNGAHKKDAMYVTSIEFADGSKWNQDDILKALNPEDGDTGGDGDDGTGGDPGNVDTQYDEVWRGVSASDEYEFNFDGRVIQIEDTDDSAYSDDLLSFGNIDCEDLWFDLIDDDLRISRISQEDAGFITIKKWELGADHHIEMFEAGDYRITNQEIDVLLQAMSQFDAPMGDSSHISQNDQANIRDVILSTWTQRD